MTDIILVLNAGSSSIKFAIYPFVQDDRRALVAGKISGIRRDPSFQAHDFQNQALPKGDLSDIEKTASHEELIVRLLNWLETRTQKGPIACVGHRVVHGGRQFTAPVLLDEDIMRELATLNTLAPLHQPHNLAAIEVIRKRLPSVPQIACFDTSFHHTQRPLAKLFALPRALSEEGVVRYGFHGLSYNYIASVLPRHLGNRAEGRIIVAHLGNGASLCAMEGRKSVATSMGFTALDGLMMGRRCGALDVGVVLYLLKNKKMTPLEVEYLLYNESGLLGVSQISNNMKDLEESNKAEAREAIDLYCYRAATEIGKLLPAIGGLDGIVFTAGIGENSSLVRSKICHHLDWMGIEIDETANEANEAKISSRNSAIDVLVTPTDEEIVIANAARVILG
jgi:acetate kinase